MNIGKVIVLNGASSAGKSTLSRALQKTLDECWWHVSMDAFTAMQLVEVTGEARVCENTHPSWNPDVRLSRFLSGWYQTIRALALTGNNVIADAGFLKTEWLLEQVAALDGIEALYVGVYCPLPELARRERARGDRTPGYAQSQHVLVHQHGPYDVEVDTSVLAPDDAAQRIKTALANPPAPSAFDRIRASNAAEKESG